MGMLDGLYYLAGFASEQWKSPEEIRILQGARLGKAFETASGSPYYRAMLEGAHSASDHFSFLGSLPTTSKEVIQANPGAFIADAFRGKPVISTETTGSTGKPLTVKMDQKASTMRTALLLQNSFSCGLGPLSKLAYLLFQHDPRPDASGRLHGVIPWFALDILQDERKNLALIRKHGADSLGYYPSAASLLARVNLDSGKTVSLKRILCGSEMLTPAWRRLLEESFSCPVFNKYGSWEFGPIACECPEKHSLHVNTGTFHMEILDSKDRPVRGDAVGRIVLTSLCNRAMPLIRYEMGDLASWGSRCACGRGLPVLKTLEGRSDDMVVLPSGRLRSPLSVRFTDLECVVKGIWNYQLIQEKEDLFLFRYVPSASGFPESSKREIERRIRIACLGEQVKVEFECAQEIKLNRRGKLNRLISKVSRRRSIQERCEPS